MRKFAAASVIFLITVGVAMGEEFFAIVKKVDGDKITLTKLKKGEKGAEETLTIAANAKVVKGNRNKDTKKVEAGEALEGGLKNERIVKGGFGAWVVTDNDKKVTELRVTEGKKKDTN